MRSVWRMTLSQLLLMVLTGLDRVSWLALSERVRLEPFS
jgi:hypothetical protein